MKKNLVLIAAFVSCSLCVLSCSKADTLPTCFGKDCELPSCAPDTVYAETHGPPSANAQGMYNDRDNEIDFDSYAGDQLKWMSNMGPRAFFNSRLLMDGIDYMIVRRTVPVELKSPTDSVTAQWFTDFPGTGHPVREARYQVEDTIHITPEGYASADIKVIRFIR